MNDREAFYLYPEDNWVYDKTEIASVFEVDYGKLIPDDKEYCVKPKINLEGCSIGSKFVKNLEGFVVPEGLQWFEKLEGIHWTCDFIKTENGWEMMNIFSGVPFIRDHTKFQFWYTIDAERFEKNNLHLVMDPCQKILAEIKSAPVVNFEFIGTKAIECHLRGNTDPVEYDLIIPDWEGIYRDKQDMKEQGFIYIEDKQEHPGRKGFWVK